MLLDSTATIFRNGSDIVVPLFVLMHHHPARLQDRIGDQADDGGDRDQSGLLTFQRNSTASETIPISAVSQSPIAMRPSRMQAPRIVPIAAA